jgi:hypothetical protein
VSHFEQFYSPLVLTNFDDVFSHEYSVSLFMKSGLDATTWLGNANATGHWQWFHPAPLRVVPEHSSLLTRIQEEVSRQQEVARQSPNSAELPDDGAYLPDRDSVIFDDGAIFAPDEERHNRMKLREFLTGHVENRILERVDTDLPAYEDCGSSKIGSSYKASFSRSRAFHKHYLQTCESQVNNLTLEGSEFQLA